jgi:hypothetical protein
VTADRIRLATVVAAALALAGCAAAPDGAPAASDRQAEVAQRGGEVMPFDLDRTTHRFTPTGDGLLQEVVADDPAEATQVRLVREHLTAEAARFRAGDYGDPARIHGAGMPGLAELSAGAAAIEITYAEITAGAALRFRSADPALVRALHAWGQAQVSDHGAHAEHGGTTPARTP